MKLFKKRLSKDFVETSFGKIYYKILTKGMVDEVTNKSLVNGVFNNNRYFQLMEYKLLDLSKRKIYQLSLDDDRIIREKTKKILERYGLVSFVKKEEVKNVEDTADLHKDFLPEEIKWFNESKQKMLGKNGLS